MRFHLPLLLLLSSVCLAGEFRIPLMDQPPVLDGKVDAMEWGRAMGTAGLCWSGQFAVAPKRQS